MWTRRQIKGEAKDFLRSNYFKALIVCIIFHFILNGANVLYESNNPDVGIESYNYMLDLPIGNYFYRGFEMTQPFSILNLLMGGIFSIFIIVIILISVLIEPLLKVGRARFFLRGLEGDTDIRYLFSSFNKDEFWNVFKVGIIKNIYIFLWSLLFFIPGIVKSYEYAMVDYILANKPNLSHSEAIQTSRNMTYGHKFDMFVLDLSFIGWRLLSSLLFGVGVVLVDPYIYATRASLYTHLLENNKDDFISKDGVNSY